MANSPDHTDQAASDVLRMIMNVRSDYIATSFKALTDACTGVPSSIRDILGVPEWVAPMSRQGTDPIGDTIRTLYWEEPECVRELVRKKFFEWMSERAPAGVVLRYTGSWLHVSAIRPTRSGRIRLWLDRVMARVRHEVRIAFWEHDNV